MKHYKIHNIALTSATIFAMGWIGFSCVKSVDPKPVATAVATATTTNKPSLIDGIATATGLKDDGGASAKDLDMPPSEGPLPVDRALKSFVIPKGLRIECVASEPMIEDPIDVQWDARGRMWVVEMRGYMSTVDGGAENDPVGRISILEDTKGTGVYDKKTIFLDNLILPRTVSLVSDGALVAVPPNLYFCQDTKGDGKCDKQTLVAADYAKGGSVEHQPNGLIWMMDNSLYSAKSSMKYRYDGKGKFSFEPTAFRGQWGMSQDDHGRLFYNYNSDGLRADIVPSDYVQRNAHYRSASGVNVKIINDQRVYPARKNLTNRSYRITEVGPEGKLLVLTGACAPVINRSPLFGKEYFGDSFVAEVAGNLIRRDKLIEKDNTITATSVHDKTDFIASTDERFRPVNMHIGPDGALYIVDMYRGVIQDKVFVSAFLRRQSISRGLDKGLHYGRVYRVVPEDFKQPVAPNLASNSSAELVAQLNHPISWYRDTTQRLLVERALDTGDETSVAPLKALIANGENPLGRLHALWTLDGMKKSDEKTLLAAMNDKEPHVRAAALRLIEPFLRGKTAADLMPQVLKLAGDNDPIVKLQFALSLSPFTAADDALYQILTGPIENSYLRDAVITGLFGREGAVLEKLLKDKNFAEKAAGRADVLTALSQCVFADGKRQEGIVKLLEQVVSQKPGNWKQIALLDGIIGVAPKDGKPGLKVKPVRLDGPPAQLEAIKKITEKAVVSRAPKLDSLIVWVGKPGVKVPPPPPPLSGDEAARFEAGKQLYQTTCGACHQPTGLGHEGLAPPLVGSEWVDGPPERIARIVLNGLDGEIKVAGAKYKLEMPPLKALEDDQIAALITYIRREWDHESTPVDVALVKKVRAEVGNRETAWTAHELEKVK